MYTKCDNKHYFICQRKTNSKFGIEADRQLDLVAFVIVFYFVELQNYDRKSGCAEANTRK